MDPGLQKVVLTFEERVKELESLIDSIKIQKNEKLIGTKGEREFRELVTKIYEASEKRKTLICENTYFDEIQETEPSSILNKSDLMEMDSLRDIVKTMEGKSGLENSDDEKKRKREGFLNDKSEQKERFMKEVHEIDNRNEVDRFLKTMNKKEQKKVLNKLSSKTPTIPKGWSKSLKERKNNDSSNNNCFHSSLLEGRQQLEKRKRRNKRKVEKRKKAKTTFIHLLSPTKPESLGLFAARTVSSETKTNDQSFKDDGRKKRFYMTNMFKEKHEQRIAMKHLSSFIPSSSSSSCSGRNKKNLRPHSSSSLRLNSSFSKIERHPKRTKRWISYSSIQHLHGDHSKMNNVDYYLNLCSSKYSKNLGDRESEIEIRFSGQRKPRDFLKMRGGNTVKQVGRMRMM